MKWWKNEIGHFVLADLTTATFAGCRDKLSKKTNKGGKVFSSDSVKKYFGVMKSVLKTCVIDWLWIEESPLRDRRVELPELPPGRVRYLDDQERDRLLAACKNSNNLMLYPAFVLALSTGMCQSETMNLFWKEPTNPLKDIAWGVVYLEQNCIILHQTKNGSKRRIPLIGLALQLLSDLNKAKRLDTTLVFPSSIQSINNSSDNMTFQLKN